MSERDIAALESYQLIPRLLHDVVEVDASCDILGCRCEAPILPLLEAGAVPAGPASQGLSLLEGDLPEGAGLDLGRVVVLLKNDKMGELMPRVRALSARGVPAVALDVSVLADTPPYGSASWRPKTREDLAELRAAAGCPLWLYGICSPDDAEVAAEAGLEGIVVASRAGRHLSSPGTAEVFPDIFDAVAGMIMVLAGGPVRSGIDVFRYLALGAEAVVADSDRALRNLQAELGYAMRLTGCRTLAEISYEAIFAPLFGEL